MPNTIQWGGPNIELKCQSVWSLYSVWPLTASMEVKNKYAYGITQDICNKFIEVNFFCGMHGLIAKSSVTPLNIFWIINKIHPNYVCTYILKTVYQYLDKTLVVNILGHGQKQRQKNKMLSWKRL